VTRARAPWVVVATWIVASTALAEEPDAPAGREPDTLAPDAPLVLRPVPELGALAEGVAATLRRRTSLTVEVGDAPPPDILEAVPAHHVALARDETGVVLVLGGSGGLSYSTRLDLPRTRGDAAVRAVALAIEALHDAASDGPPPEREEGDTSSFVTRWTLITPIPRRAPRGAIARPAIYLRLLLGISPVRGTFLVGPGAGLGLCVGSSCVVIEGDLSLLADETTASDGAVIRYRPINVSVRAQFRPDWDDLFIPGATLGLVTRIGNAQIVGTDVSQTVSNLGIRATLELGLRFFPPFEFVIEGGVDLAISRAQFVRFGELVVLEDLWTPWVVTSFRLRPSW
jgi:hypothetical protein